MADQVRRNVAQVVGLECRQLLAAWASLSDGNWTIHGTDNSDAILIEADVDTPSRAVLYVNGKLRERARLRDVRSIHIDSAGGNDRVTVNLSERATSVKVVVDGGWGNDTLTGGRTADELHGGLGRDSLLGRDGRDSLFGDHGDDQLVGGDGDDLLQGNLGKDQVDGGLGRDLIDGGRDNDRLLGSGGRDTLNGAAGVDSLDGGSGRDVMAGGSSLDRIIRTLGRDIVKDSTARQVSPADISRLGQISNSDLVNQLIDYAARTYRSTFGTSTNGYPTRYTLDAFTNSLSAADATNTQESGIDEADVVESDGHYLFSLDSDEFRIIDLSNPDSMSKLSTTSVHGNAVGLYLLDGDRLVVISTTTSAVTPETSSAIGDLTILPPTKLVSTVRVATYDVSNKRAPVEVGHTDFEGMYVDSRVVNSSVYLITGQNILFSPQYVRQSGSTTGRFETEAQYRARMLATADDWMPSFTATRNGQSTTGSLLTDGNVFLPEPGISGDRFATVSLLDGRNAGNGVIDSTSVAGDWVSTVYATDSSIYLAGQTWDGESSVPQTSIAKVAISESSVEVQANGIVNGTLLSQFSLDEEFGQLRMAVTQGSAGSAIYVLQAQGDTLDIVGQLTGLAPGEQIYSTRFDGDRAYVVTFRQIDPLFVIDLSDASKPTLAGELKIPGVSHMLVPISNHFVLGIGNDGDSTGQLTSLQVSLFDVSNAASPLRVSTFDFDPSEINWWSVSNTAREHHSIQYFADEGILSLPVNRTQAEPYTQLIRVNTDTGTLSDAGTIDNAASVGTRTVKIDQTLYVVDVDSVSTYSLATSSARGSLIYNVDGSPAYGGGGWGWWGNVGFATIFTIVD